MIRLHQFKRHWGIANPSPFCMKVETYLRMTGLAYEVIEEASPLNAPKKKLPYIDDGEKLIPDSGFIIDYLKASYGNPLDGGLSRAQQAEAHLLRRNKRCASPLPFVPFTFTPLLYPLEVSEPKISDPGPLYLARSL